MSIDELGTDSCSVILQATMSVPGKLESAGLAVMPKVQKTSETEFLRGLVEEPPKVFVLS